MFCSSIHGMFPLPSGQRQTLRVTGWVSEVPPHPTLPLPLPYGESKGVGEKVRVARRAPQYRR